MTAITQSHAPGPARGPVRRSERALAPDLARGTMLLFIALANAAVATFGNQPGAEASPHGWERPFNLAMFVFVHARAYPMFAVMFGYGLVQLTRRQDAEGSGPGAARSVLLKRNAWLIAFGLVHAALLNFGDFLGAYGIVGIAFTLLLLRRGERVHRVVLWLWGCTVVYAAALAAVAGYRATHGGPGSAAVPTDDVDSLTAPDYLTSVADRLGEWPIHTLTALGIVVIVWLGAWAARRGILEDPARHRRLLVRTAVVGLGTAFAGGVPIGLVSGGFVHVDDATADAFLSLYEVSGQFGGPGYVALFGLLALRLSKARSTSRRRLPAEALAALGQRSLSGYLFQSLAWVVLLSPFALALGERTGSPTLTACLSAVLVWLATVTGAHLLQRRSLPGPAEKLLRRLTYGPR
ncbi:DUF418 domain-containing protein [Streptomyces rapamycinicus]|uniref:Membrane protein YeiB n=1 Tax=Streptomyces rapamycinicus TaxID=1226757 RepID=A0ABR6M2S6_9ACTN|nr:DUF418 domain-containing protein [Streptomyces rapamycinicus]MBB4788918.1 putative membrane protein YeiB [Streptomyces rapamycinicus]UTO67594.1 DUF418 domain-containing protein [Streptomyces rapamycinicus]UTP35547.1 DUF418 domain-containing protein [Streptomyces rapamycinicus NRRL 5491]